MKPPTGYRSEAGFGGGAERYNAPAPYGGDAERYEGTAGPGRVQVIYKTASTGGITTEEEKNHVIKVLEHESKVYRFEKNLMNLVGGADFDVYSEQGRNQKPRNPGFDF